MKGHFKQSGVSIYSAECLFLNCYKSEALKGTESCALLKGAAALEKGEKRNAGGGFSCRKKRK